MTLSQYRSLVSSSYRAGRWRGGEAAKRQLVHDGECLPSLGQRKVARAFRAALIRRQLAALGPRLVGPTYTGYATYYSHGSCDSTGGGERTSLGTQVRFGEVAQSTLPLGTEIWVVPAILGRHEFRVEDHFGSPQAAGRIDVFLECGETIPNPRISFRAVG